MKKHRMTGRSLCLFWQGVLLVVISSSQADILDNWHSLNPMPFANSIRSSCFGAGRFVGVGDGGVIHTSPDGINWDDGRRLTTSALRKVIFANGLFVAVGHDGVILSSSDGNSWTARASGTSNALYSVAYGNGQFVACGAGGRLAISANGSLWTPSLVGANDLTWITFGNGIFVVPAPNASPSQLAVRVSTDGQGWTTQSFPAGTSFYYPNTL